MPIDHLIAADTAHPSISCAVLTISDTRTPETDTSGQAIRELLSAGGHEIVQHALVPDEPDLIRQQLREWTDDPAIRVIITTGGTGVSPRDGTVEVVRDLLTMELDGFGELFRMISYQEIGASAMLSRATAGLVVCERGGDTFLFALPGSTNAVRTAMSKLIVSQLGHLVWQR